jgi:hypothetical protein
LKKIKLKEMIMTKTWNQRRAEKTGDGHQIKEASLRFTQAVNIIPLKLHMPLNVQQETSI